MIEKWKHALYIYIQNSSNETIASYEFKTIILFFNLENITPYFYFLYLFFHRYHATLFWHLFKSTSRTSVVASRVVLNTVLVSGCRSCIRIYLLIYHQFLLRIWLFGFFVFFVWRRQQTLKKKFKMQWKIRGMVFSYVFPKSQRQYDIH